MILYTNGCSWTYGGELEPYFVDNNQRQQLVWPYHLGKKLKAEKIVNLSWGCGSNQRIFRTTLDWIKNQEKQNLENVFAVIQLTDSSRYEFNFPDWNGIPDSWARCKVGHVSNLPAGWTDQEYDYYSDLNDRRLATFTDEEGFYNTATLCEALDNVFKKHRIKYYLWFAFGQFNYMEDSYKNYFLSNFPFLNVQDQWKYEKFDHQSGHPTLLGHQQIAEQIFNDINLEI